MKIKYLRGRPSSLKRTKLPIVLGAALLLAACSSGAGSSHAANASSNTGGSTTPISTPSGEGGGSSSGAPSQGQSLSIAFQLNFYAGGANAGFALALQDGLYKKAGLNVTIIQGSGSTTTAQLVASGKAKLAYADAIPVMQLIGKGAPMQIVSTIYQSNPNSVTVLDGAGVTKIQDLKGKSIGVPNGGSQTAMIPLLLKANGLSESDVKLVNLASTALVPSLLTHKVDAILGSIDAYTPQLTVKGAKTIDFPFYNHGVPTVSTSIFGATDYLQQHKKAVQDFIAASAQGWELARQDPDAAIKALQKTFPSVTDTQLNKLELQGAVQLLCANGAQFIGKATESAWQSTTSILEQTLGLTTQYAATKYYTYDYLPSTLPKC